MLLHEIEDWVELVMLASFANPQTSGGESRNRDSIALQDKNSVAWQIQAPWWGKEDTTMLQKPWETAAQAIRHGHSCRTRLGLSHPEPKAVWQT